MKRYFILSCFFISSLVHLFAQNWTIVNPEYAYHYIAHDAWGEESDSLNPFTLQVDSTSGDTSWMRHRLVEMGLGPDHSYHPYPLFLQYEMIQLPDQGIWFRDTGSFVIFPPASWMDTWLFDTLSNITATEVSIVETSSYQQTDSVRLILLSSGDTILQSKHFGMLRFPDGYGNNSYFRQVGIDGAEMGFNFPDFYDMYAWKAGDRYEYKTTLSFEQVATFSQADTCNTVTTTRQMDILEVDTIPEGLAIKIVDKVHIGDTTYNTWDNQFYRQEATSYAYVHWDTIFKDENPFYFWDHIPQLHASYEVPDLSAFFPHQQITFVGNVSYHPSHFVTYFYPSSGHLKNTLTKRLIMGDCGTGNTGSPPTGPTSISCGPAWIYWEGYAWWSKGLGLIRTQSDLPELHTQYQRVFYHRWLDAYQQGDSTHGTFSPETFFPVSIEDSELKSVGIEVYPNPTEGRIHLNNQTAIPFFHAEVLDIRGKVLQMESFSGQGLHEMKLNDVPAGLYLLKLSNPQSGDHQWTRLLVR